MSDEPDHYVTPVVTENAPCDHPGPTDNPRYQRTCRVCGRVIPESPSDQEET